MTMRDEATDAYCAAREDGPPDASMWELTPPPRDDRFLGSVHDTGDGPACYWFRHIKNN